MKSNTRDKVVVELSREWELVFWIVWQCGLEVTQILLKPKKKVPKNPQKQKPPSPSEIVSKPF